MATLAEVVVGGVAKKAHKAWMPERKRKKRK